MTKTLVATIALLSVALAGCSDDGSDTASTPDCDPATHFLDAQGVCNPHVEPRIVVQGMPDQVQQYLSAPFTWSLDNGTRGTSSAPVHSMDSRILASLEDTPVTNATGPDDWGTEIASEAHKNFPNGPFDGSFQWEETGTVYVKGYMLIDGANVWQDLGSIEVTPVQPTGDVTEVTIEQGPPPALSEKQTGITVGGAVKWINDNAAYGYTISFECSQGVSVDPVTVAAGGQSGSVAFLAPTSCDYTASSEASSAGVTQADLTGTVNVNKP